MRKFLRLFCCFAFLICGGTRVQSGVLAYDTFEDYQPIELFLQASGVGFRGGWTDSGFGIDGAWEFEVEWPGLRGEKKVYLAASSLKSRAIRTFAEPITEGRTAYVRFWMRPFAITSDSTFGLGLGMTHIRLLVGKEIGQNNLMLGGIRSDDRIEANTTYLIVAKVEVLPGADRFTLYRMSSLWDPEPTEMVWEEFDFGNFESISLYGHNAEVGFDDIVVGETLSDVLSPSLPLPPWIEVEAASTVQEGNAGETELPFTVSLSKPFEREVSFNFRVVPNTATRDEDFLPMSTTFTFPPGTTSASGVVKVLGDGAKEPDEIMRLVFFDAVNAGFEAADLGQDLWVRILNDDTEEVPQELSIKQEGSELLIEWNAGSGGKLEWSDSVNGSPWTEVSPVAAGQIYSARLPVLESPRYFRTRR